MSVPLKKDKLNRSFNSSRKLADAEGFAMKSFNKGKSYVNHVTEIVRKRFPARHHSQHEEEVPNENLKLEKEPIEDIFEAMRDMFSESCENLPVYKDVPRLVRRVKIQGSTSDEVVFDAKAENAETGAIQTAQLVVKMVKAISEKLENDEQVDLVHKESEDALAKVTESTDLQFFMKDLVRAIGVNTRTVKVLKCLHQNVVLQATWKLKQTVTKDFMTKDMRTDDGWQILITLAEYIQVRHMRREQSIDAFGDVKNHWEFDWEIALSFDKEMEELTQSRLRITKLTLSEDMDKEIEDKLKTTLMNGDLIVM